MATQTRQGYMRGTRTVGPTKGIAPVGGYRPGQNLGDFQALNRFYLDQNQRIIDSRTGRPKLLGPNYYQGMTPDDINQLLALQQQSSPQSQPIPQGQGVGYIDPVTGQRSRVSNPNALDGGDRRYNDLQQLFDPGDIFSKPRKNKTRDYLWNDLTGGYEAVLGQLEQGGGSDAAIQDILTKFKGDPDEFADFMERVGPLLGSLEARKAERSQAFQYMADQGNWDMGALGSYGPAASQIARGTQQAQLMAQQRGAASGLRGNTSAISSLLAQRGATEQSNLRSQVEQQAARNRMQSANSLFDAHRSLAQMALGQGITPRITSPQGSDTGIGGIAGGAAAGASLGSVAGPWGSLVGAVGGGLYGAYQDRKQ